MRPLYLLPVVCLALCHAHSLNAQIIPSDRFYDWHGAGFRGSMPDHSNSVNILDLGAANDSSSSVNGYLQTAIDSLQGRYGVIYFPPGNYLFNSQVTLPDSVVLKGAGADSTALLFNMNGAPNDCIEVSKSQDEVLDPFTNIISGGEKGSATLAVTDGSSFAPNTYAEIRQDNGSWNTVPASWAEQAVGQIVKVVAISGNSLQIEPALRIDLDTMLNAQIRRIMPATYVGIECLTITRQDMPSSNSVYNINFQFAVNCWVRGIESSLSMGAHVMIELSKNIEVSGCYVHHSFAYDGSGTSGYGVCLRQHASDCLVENNFFRHLRHAMMVKEGANGNVFGYNYSIEPNRSEPIPDFSGDISLHGHYAFANLFEGNIVQNIIIDQAWGQSGPHNTFLRNRAELYGMGVLPGSPPYTNDQNFVGNEITSTTVLQGNYYTQYGTGHFEFGNNVKGTVMPSGTTPLPDSSYYLTTRPLFWDNTSWPSVGIPNTIGSGSIPAKNRYVAGGALTLCETASIVPCDTLVCDDSDICTMDSCVNGSCAYTFIPGCSTGIKSAEATTGISIYPNPTNNFIIVELENISQFPVDIAIMDYTGRIIWKDMVESSTLKHQLGITLPENMSSGLYLLQVILGEITFHQKFIKQ